ncbi:hypothetical protein P7K49_030483 [Saguinus oedipus]|uniref:Uncharacterized protein n=1 Tax=Saguinus oedipus TaxID=9490 RepID=A0ABQ9U2A7_SAGOE|nr:hypothetical protein P7K49_030483 [Saguinus oedipus]
MAHTRNLRQLPGPCPPLPRAAPVKATPPAPPAALSAHRDPSPPPHPPPPRARPAQRPRSLRAGAGARGVPQNLRHCQTGASPTYAVFLLLRGGPHGRAGHGPAGAATGRQRGGNGRGPGCGGGQAARGSGRRIPHRPYGMPPPPPPRLDREDPRVAQQPQAARARARHLSVAAAPAPPLASSQLRRLAPGAAAARLAPTGSQDGGACATPCRARARATRARAPLLRASGGKSARGDWTGWARTGFSPDLVPSAAANSGGGEAGQVGDSLYPDSPLASASSASFLRPEMATGLLY